MTETVTGFYKSILTLPSVDPEMQRQILRYGEGRNDHALLAALAARNDILPEVDNALGKFDAAVVRVAWASQPGRSESELVDIVTGEKRVKVLAALAAREDLPVAMHTAIAEHGRGNALEELMLNNSVAPDVKVVAAKRYASLYVNSKKVPKSARALFKAQPMLADVVAATSKNFQLIATAVSACGPASSIDALRNARALAEGFIMDPANDGWAAVDPIETVGDALASSYNRDEVLFAEYIQLMRKAASEKKSSVAKWISERLMRIADDLEKVNPPAKGTVDPATVARSVNDPEAAERFVSSMGTSLDVSALIAIAMNPAFNASQFSRAVEVGKYGWYALTDLGWVFPKLPADKAAVILLHWSYFDDEQLKRHPAPSEVLIQLAKLSQDAVHTPTVLYQSKFITDEVIDHLPLSIYGNQQGSIPLQVTERLAKRVLGRLGEDQALWENLNALSSGFTGSLNDLIDVAARL